MSCYCYLFMFPTRMCHHVIRLFPFFSFVPWVLLLYISTLFCTSSRIWSIIYFNSLCFSVRWKLLLGFSCRNRLLLSGTPIQNSMAELWALLHFIMPTLFDSHDEFNEWFSKDIESHAENKTGIDESKYER